MQRHDTDLLSLFFGSVLGLTGLILLGGDPSRGSATLAWAGPLVAAIAGVIVVLAMWPRSGQRPIEATEPEQADGDATHLAAPVDSEGTAESVPDRG